jgi:ABC-type multidrug transport system fused ATPase/permease subunit
MKTLFRDFKNTFVFLKGHYLKYFTGIVGMTILNASCALVESYLLKHLLDIGRPDSLNTILKLFIVIIFYMILVVLLLPVFSFMFNGQAKYGFGNICKAIYSKLSKLSVDYYEKNHTEQALSLLENDSWVVAVIFMRHFRRTVAAFATIIIYLIPMFIFDYRITAIILVLNILTFFVNTNISRKLKKTKKEVQKNLSNMTVILGNVIGGISIIRMYDMTKFIKERFENSNREVSKSNIKNSRVTAFLSAYNFMISMCNIMVFVLIGTLMVKWGLTTYGNIIAIMSLQTTLDFNFREFARYYPLFYNSFAGTERIYDFLEQEEEPKKRDANIIENPEYIEFKDVTFGYTEDKTVLENFNLSVSKGETVAIIGESGSGKSSLVKLLMGFYKINSGGISVNSKNIGHMTLDELRRSIAYVPQESSLFNISIKENIRYGNPAATDEQIIEAAKAAYAHDFITEQPQGYDTIVGERGIRLSGGQCQRIAIARAMVKDAPILILDEATSALDSESERYIKEAIDSYSKTRTTLIIAHRLSTIENADRVIKIEAVS